MEANVEKCVKALIYAIRTSETYQNYQRCELKLSRQPELRKKIRSVQKEGISDQYQRSGGSV